MAYYILMLLIVHMELGLYEKLLQNYEEFLYLFIKNDRWNTHISFESLLNLHMISVKEFFKVINS